MRTQVSKVVFLDSQPLHSYLERILGIEYLLSRGFEVEYVDVGHTLGTARWLTGVALPASEYVSATAFDRVEDLQTNLRSLGPDVCVVNNVGYQPDWVHRSVLVWRELWRSRAVLGVAAASFASDLRLSRTQQVGNSISSHALRHPRLLGSLSRHFVSLARSERLSRIADLRDFGLTMNAEDYRPLDFLWGSVPPARSSLSIVGKSTRRRVLHTFNADSALYGVSKAPELNRPYVAFLDSMAGGIHPDFGHNGFECAELNPALYYHRLGSLFRWAEEAYGLPIVVAAHPKLTTTMAAQYFPDTHVVHGETASVVAGSDFVIAEPSSSVDFAAWFGKPLLMLKSEGFPSWLTSISESYASALGSPTLSLEDASSAIPRPVISTKRAGEFVRTWMKARHSEVRPFWAAVADDLQGGAG